jgi:hypothetical protein
VLGEDGRPQGDRGGRKDRECEPVGQRKVGIDEEQPDHRACQRGERLGGPSPREGDDDHPSHPRGPHHARPGKHERDEARHDRCEEKYTYGPSPSEGPDQQAERERDRGEVRPGNGSEVSQPHDAHLANLAFAHLGGISDDHADRESPDGGRECSSIASEGVAKVRDRGRAARRGAVRGERRVPGEGDGSAGRGRAQLSCGGDRIAVAEFRPPLARKDDDLGAGAVARARVVRPPRDGHDYLPALILGAVALDADRLRLAHHGALEGDALARVDDGADAPVPSRGVDEVGGRRDREHRRAGDPHRAGRPAVRGRDRQDRPRRAHPPPRGGNSGEHTQRGGVGGERARNEPRVVPGPHAVARPARRATSDGPIPDTRSRS